MRRLAIAIVEVVIFSTLIVATRCANYREVFFAGGISFTDADCYARMTRARICLENPGRVIRHHDFENFPAGTTPHTTAPLDYLIAGLAFFLRSWTTRSLDVAGAIISPLIGLLAGWFLWWWSWRIRLRYRSVLLLLYAVSPILVHGTELGRPDHQSLLIGLLCVALAAECTLSEERSQGWGITSGAAWGLALWISLYEPLILLGVLVASQLVAGRKTFLGRHRLAGWLVCGAIVLFALAIERRLPVWPQQTGSLINWTRTIGELAPVSISDPSWLRWGGLLLLPLPALLWIAGVRLRTIPPFLVAMLLATFCLTLWQARWGYFFVLVFAISLPFLLRVIPHRIAGGILFAISLFPILREWDERLWPDESKAAALAERRVESVQFRQIAGQLDGPFIAPWWWSPALAYWSGQPGVAGSSHEALDGIRRSAELYLASEAQSADQVLSATQVKWMVAYDADRLLPNSSALLARSVPENALGRILDEHPSLAPPQFELSFQNSVAKLFHVRFFREK